MVTWLVPVPAVVQVLPPTIPSIAPPLSESFTLSLHDALPIWPLPSPLSVLTVAVMTWSLPSSLVLDRKSTCLNSSHLGMLYAALCLKRTSPVERVSTMPPTVGLMVAWMATWPEVGELMVTEQV